MGKTSFFCETKELQPDSMSVQQDPSKFVPVNLLIKKTYAGINRPRQDWLSFAVL
jgi:hypothetical protein